MIFVPKLIKHGIVCKIQRSFNASCGESCPSVTDVLSNKYDTELRDMLPYEGVKLRVTLLRLCSHH